jgi:peptidyl-prolyl cis-trans isomerase SurA
MKPGEVTEPLRSPRASTCQAERAPRRRREPAPVTQTRARHILVRTSEVVSENEARRRLNDMRERIVNGTADFAELAQGELRRYRQRRARRRARLDLSRRHRAGFRARAAGAQAGEISQPVKTPFGYHLIQVLERRSSDVSQERRRLEARKVLRERKSEDAYQEWLRQLRDQAYVELRLEER